VVSLRFGCSSARGGRWWSSPTGGTLLTHGHSRAASGGADGSNDPVFLVLDELPPDPERWGIRDPVGMPLDPDRWAEERQYLRNDTATALAALRRRRRESLAFLNRLAPAEWRRGSVHVTLGPMTFDDWTALMAAHDDKHLAQLLRALDGTP